MTNQTANFALPYPSATDEPCDFAQQWCDFTDAIDDVFAVFQSAIDRTIPVIPMAILQMTTSNSVINFNDIRFDTVLVDTARMTDIDVDPFHVTVHRPGRYTVAVFVAKPTAGAPFVPLVTSIFNQIDANAQADVVDRGAGVEYYLNGYWAVQTYTAGTQISLTFGSGAQQAFTIDLAWLAVIWHSDTEVP